ncbi:exosortase [Alteromonas pelagimontana]|uniref:Exosortase n=1 Tax=Alteromonas pelagimontana TaxID=1858656 RepID=A0A6M4MFT1_9ALTE|nr:exosortase [Alteromonas pelagimontana]QJR81969.1 exosortase [Alteromonas pelagimontana]
MSAFRFKALLWLIAGAVIAGLAIPNTYISLHELWSRNNEAYSHGYILLIFIAYVLATDKRWQSFHASWWPVPVAFGAGAFWLAANAVQVIMLQQIVLPVLLLCLTASLVGVKNSLKVIVPIFSLYLAIPVMDVLLTPLQNLTTYINTLLIQATGIVAFIDGYDIHMPYGVMRIANGCAGLNYLLAGLCLGLFYAYLNLQRLSLQIWAVVLMVLLSLVGNWIRVYLLILIGYQSEMQSSLVYDHGFFGWVIFAVLAVFYFLYTKRLEAKDTEFEATSAEPVQPVSGKLIATTSLTLIAFLVLPVTWKVIESNASSQKAVTVSLPDTFNYFTESEKTIANFGANYEGADSEKVYQGQINGRSATLMVASYVTQAQGKELIYYANHPAKALNRRQLITLPEGTVNVAVTDGGRALVVWFYRVDDHVTTDDLDTKLAQLLQVFEVPVASAIVLQIRCNGKCDNISQDIEDNNEWLDALFSVEVN